MFARALVVLTLAAAVLATPAVKRANDVCKSGKAMCCDQIAPTGQEAAAGPLGGLVPIVLQGLNIPIGLQCNPISVLALASAGNCNSQAACCQGSTHNDLVGLDCVPINAQL